MADGFAMHTPPFVIILTGKPADRLLECNMINNSKLIPEPFIVAAVLRMCYRAFDAVAASI